MTPQELLAASAAANANNGEDLTKASAGGGFVREVPKAGVALMRLQSYIEMGKKQPKNKAHKPSVDCIFTFELLHPRHMITPEGKDPFPMTYTMHVSKAGTATSRYRKLFSAMNWEGTHTHFDTMIGKTAFLGELFHVPVDPKDEKKGVYVNLNDSQGVWQIGAPKHKPDPINNPDKVVDVPVPEMHQDGKLFLWENPGWTDEIIAAAWDMLYIEGNHEDGRSKNWIQDGIMQAVDWEGSQTQSVVENGTMELPTEMAEEEIAAVAANQKANPADAIVPEEDSDAAALAALGL